MEDSIGSKYRVYYVGCTQGFIHKLVHSEGGEKSVWYADRWRITNEPIRMLELSLTLSMLYVAADSG